jgi:radical SAM protein with 4Fe4S-binding SPASM domain
MATNGTCASKRLIDLIKRYDVRFVVSLDGPPEINDRLRTTASGKGVYARIRENIQILRRETGFPKGIAFTYTAWHLRCNRALWDMLCALRDDTGIAEFAVMPATDSPHTSGTWDPLLVDPDRYIDDYVDCIRNSLREMASQENPILIDGVRNILAMLVHREQYQPCPAATSYFTVSANGDIYPCQNLSEDITCRITSLTSDTFARDLQTSPIRERILAANLAAIERIGDIPGLPACRICPSDNLGETGSLTEYAPQRFRLYQAVDRVVKDFFLNVIVNGTETERRRLLTTLAG